MLRKGASSIGRFLSGKRGAEPTVEPSSGDRDPVDEMIPDAATANYVGGGGIELFKEVGAQLVGAFKLHADLKPHEAVLDVGCGIGRIAVPLTQYLTTGTYDGFDIVPHGIAWCQSRITHRYPNFRFFHSDIHNQHYNPGGRLVASEYRFPFEDGTFDFVFLTSVFTHMLPPDMRHYVAEIGRVLKPGGRCFCTAFVISPEALAHLQRKESGRLFEPQPGGYWTDNPGNPEAATAYSQDDLTQVFGESNLEVARLIPGGWWSNPFAQDIIIARKAG